MTSPGVCRLCLEPRQKKQRVKKISKCQNESASFQYVASHPGVLCFRIGLHVLSSSSSLLHSEYNSKDQEGSELLNYSVNNCRTLSTPSLNPVTCYHLFSESVVSLPAGASYSSLHLSREVSSCFLPLQGKTKGTGVWL